MMSRFSSLSKTLSLSFSTTLAHVGLSCRHDSTTRDSKRRYSINPIFGFFFSFFVSLLVIIICTDSVVEGGTLSTAEMGPASFSRRTTAAFVISPPSSYSSSPSSLTVATTNALLNRCTMSLSKPRNMKRCASHPSLALLTCRPKITPPAASSYSSVLNMQSTPTTSNNQKEQDDDNQTDSSTATATTTTTSSTSSQTDNEENDEDEEEEEWEIIEIDNLTENDFYNSEWKVGTVWNTNPKTIKETWVRLLTTDEGTNVAIWGDGSKGKWSVDVPSQFFSISKETFGGWGGKKIWAGTLDHYYYLQGTVRGWNFISPASVLGQWQAKRLGCDLEEMGVAPWFQEQQQQQEDEGEREEEEKEEQQEEQEKEGDMSMALTGEEENEGEEG